MSDRNGSNARNSLDVLEQEDCALAKCIASVKDHRGSSIETRYQYGALVKAITRRIAVRQSCLMDVGFAIRDVPELGEIANRMLDRAFARRPQIDKVGRMSRGVQGISLNTGQDFAAEFAPLIDDIDVEIKWELSVAIPLVRRFLEARPGPMPFRSARYVRRHARMKLSPSKRRWREWLPIVSRLLTMLDRFQDHPRESAA